MRTFVHFLLDDTPYAVPAERVIEIVPRVLLTPLPDAPAPIVGLFSHRGAPMPAVDLRARLGHPRRRPARDDHFLVVRSARRAAALIVDRVISAEALTEQAISPPPVVLPHIAGVVPRPDGILLIEDLDAVLSLDEERAIDEGLARLAAPG